MRRRDEGGRDPLGRPSYRAEPRPGAQVGGDPLALGAGAAEQVDVPFLDAVGDGGGDCAVARRAPFDHLDATRHAPRAVG